VFKGDSADMYAGKFPLVLMGEMSGPVKCAQTGSEDPHRRAEISLSSLFFRLIANSLRRVCRRVLQLTINKNIRTPTPQKTMRFLSGKGGILKSCPRVPKLKI
jgi:hypothetical protein